LCENEGAERCECDGGGECEDEVFGVHGVDG
jgi:hypothetical protein